MVQSMPWRRARHDVPADLPEGFVATEAPALQATIRSAFVAGEGAAPMAVELTFAPGAAGRVVVVWRNRNVGFVPREHADDLHRVLTQGQHVRLVAEGRLYHDGSWWRIWVGPDPVGPLPVPPAGYDELPPPAPTIFGFAFGASRPDPTAPG
ncbi:MAG: hypothetical protein KJ548_09980 [Actinobacteria bacterium]|nr:hypothetical protein [Actinomycetota bacterium]